MTPLVTILYEDSKRGTEFPLHDLVLRMVHDDINGLVWKLQKAVMDNPRNGVDNVLTDLRAASLIAGTGSVFVLVDRDVIVEHVNKNRRGSEPVLRLTASDAEIVEAILGTCDSPSRVQVFFLHPNLEGVVNAVEVCAPGRWLEEVAGAKRKKHLSRDLLLKELAKAGSVAERQCVRGRQAGLDALARALGKTMPGVTP